MAEIAESIVIAWQHAARDLGFNFTAPWHLITFDQRRITYLGLVHEFGRRSGTLLRVLRIGEMLGPEILDEDFLVAPLGERYIEYHRWLFQDTLRQWGWRGPPERRPDWL